MTKTQKTMKIKRPRLRFPGFHDEWEEKRLRDIFINSRSKGNNSLPIYSVTINNGLVRRDSLGRNIENASNPEDNLYVGKENLVYNMMRMWQGALGVADQECMVSPAYVVLKPKEEIYSLFFLKYFTRKKSHYLFESFSYGLTSDRLRLYYKDFGQIKFYVPSFAEQQRIADSLDSVDAWIKNLQEQKEKMEVYKKSILQKIFSQEIRFKDENGDEFSEWKVMMLKDLFVKKTEKNTECIEKFVLTNSATEGIIGQLDYFDKDIANQKNIKGYYIVDIDDFVYNPRISNNAPVGPMKRNTYRKGIMSPLYTVLKPKAGSDFLEKYFDTDLWHEYMRSVANYGARHDRMNIGQADLLKMPIPFPCVEEQEKITGFLSALDSQIKLKSFKLEEAKIWRKGLMQQLFI